MYCKAKKNFGAIQKILKNFIFENLLQKKRPKGGIFTTFRSTIIHLRNSDTAFRVGDR